MIFIQDFSGGGIQSTLIVEECEGVVEHIVLISSDCAVRWAMQICLQSSPAPSVCNNTGGTNTKTRCVRGWGAVSPIRYAAPLSPLILFTFTLRFAWVPAGRSFGRLHGVWVVGLGN